jgi:hypothetical protein
MGEAPEVFFFLRRVYSTGEAPEEIYHYEGCNQPAKHPKRFFFLKGAPTLKN